MEVVHNHLHEVPHNKEHDDDQLFETKIFAKRM